MEKNIEKTVENIRKDIGKLTTEDSFLKKNNRKICEKEGSNIFMNNLRKNISEYRKMRNALKQNNEDTQKYDKIISDVSLKSGIPYLPLN